MTWIAKCTENSLNDVIISTFCCYIWFCHCLNCGKRVNNFSSRIKNSIDLDWKPVAQVSVAVATNSDSVDDNSDSNWFTPLTVRWKKIQFQFWLFIDWTTIIKRKQTDVSNILNAKRSINGRAILEKCSIKCDFVLL